jgi:hypothetical protein
MREMFSSLPDFCTFFGVYANCADHSGRTVSARSNIGIVGSNPTRGMHVCVCIYSVSVLSCVQVAA